MIINQTKSRLGFVPAVNMKYLARYIRHKILEWMSILLTSLNVSMSQCQMRRLKITEVFHYKDKGDDL